MFFARNKTLQLSKGVSRKKTGLYPRPEYVKFMVYKPAIGRVLLCVLRYSPLSNIPPMPHTHSPFIFHRRYLILLSDSVLKHLSLLYGGYKIYFSCYLAPLKQGLYWLVHVPPTLTLTIQHFPSQCAVMRSVWFSELTALTTSWCVLCHGHTQKKCFMCGRNWTVKYYFMK